MTWIYPSTEFIVTLVIIVFEDNLAAPSSSPCVTRPMIQGGALFRPLLRGTRRLSCEDLVIDAAPRTSILCAAKVAGIYYRRGVLQA
jgi:hypothetical protein